MNKILIIITTEFESTGGLTTVMMNYYRAMDKTSMQIDFASTNDASDVLVAELYLNKSNYYNLGSRKKQAFRYMLKLQKLLDEQHYDAIHINGNSATMLMETVIAKRCGINRIICHTHTSQSEYPFLNMLVKPIFKLTYTKAIAVSEKSGRWLYKRNFEILNNAINTDHYRFNEEIRSQLRQKYGLEDKYVVGTVGKLTESKNQGYLLRIFAEYYKENNNSVLMIVGGGELEVSLKEQAKDLGIYDNTLFLGMREDVNRLIQCFDIFVFTSVYEGFGMVLVEAQASGLYCIASDSIPKETKITNNIEFISLRQPTSDWVLSIKKQQNRNVDRRKMSLAAYDSICEHGFNIASEAKRLEQIYLQS